MEQENNSKIELIPDIQERCHIAIKNLIRACEKQHFHNLVFGSECENKDGIHLFSVLPRTTNVPEKELEECRLTFDGLKVSPVVEKTGEDSNQIGKDEKIKPPSENHNTKYEFFEDYKELLDFVPNKEELLKQYDPTSMKIVGFRLPIETCEISTPYSIFNIHLYDINTKKRLTKNSRVGRDHVE